MVSTEVPTHVLEEWLDLVARDERPPDKAQSVHYVTPTEDTAGSAVSTSCRPRMSSVGDWM